MAEEMDRAMDRAMAGLYPEEAVRQWHQLVDELHSRRRAAYVREYTNPPMVPAGQVRRGELDELVVRHIPSSWLTVSQDYDIGSLTMRVHIELAIPDHLHADLRGQLARMQSQMSHTDYLDAVLQLIRGRADLGGRATNGVDYGSGDYTRPVPRPTSVPVAPTCQNPLSRRRNILLD